MYDKRIDHVWLGNDSENGNDDDNDNDDDDVCDLSSRLAEASATQNEHPSDNISPPLETVALRDWTDCLASVEERL